MDAIHNPDPALHLLLVFEERDASGAWRFEDIVRVSPNQTRPFRLERDQRRLRVRTELPA